MGIKIDISNALPFLTKDPFSLKEKISEINQKVLNKEVVGSEFLGWHDLPNDYQKEELKKLYLVSKEIRSFSNVLVVIGIGGSYLGAKAGLEFLGTPFTKGDMEIIFAGHNLSGPYLNDLICYLKNKEYSLNVISKSGTTTEPAIAFRILKEELERKYGKEEAQKRIIATTDESKGALFKMAKKEGYQTFVIPANIGGRFSVLTAVGLLPFLVAGFDILKILEGAKKAYVDFLDADLNQNAAFLYAATRYLLYKEAKKIELLAYYEPNLGFIGEWWKQLFGESEGKDHKGLFVASALFSTDLHSLGQYIQDGTRDLFETIIKVKKVQKTAIIPLLEDDSDGLNYLANKTLDYVNEKALLGTLMAHVSGQVPNILLEIDALDEYNLGYLFYFFEKACMISAYLIEVNPFNQPGVEDYKKNMFRLLGKNDSK